MSVSVVIPTFNAGSFLLEAVASALAQGDSVGEVIVVDDGSTDDVEALLTPYRARILYVAQRNRGAAAARNVGISLARGPYVAFLDADDVWRPHSMRRALEVFTQQPEAIGVHGLTQLYVIDRTNGEARPVRAQWRSHGVPWFCPQLGSVVLHKGRWRQLPAFDEELRFGEDLDWWIRIRDAGYQLVRHECVVLNYRIHQLSSILPVSRTKTNTCSIIKRAIDRRRRRGK